MIPEGLSLFQEAFYKNASYQVKHMSREELENKCLKLLHLCMTQGTPK